MPNPSMMTMVPPHVTGTSGRFLRVRTLSVNLAAAAMLTMLSGAAASAADEPVFSGPQPGERLAALTVTGVYDERAGKSFDPVAEADGGPVVLLFVHSVTRPGIALTRTLTEYARSLDDPKVSTTVIWLNEDKAEAEAFLTRARRSVGLRVPVAVSGDGIEGPGAYGLNRNVELTILAAKEDKVTANFALVQPSLSEATAIAGEIAKLTDATPPTAEELLKMAYPNGAPMQMRGQRGRRPAPRSSEDADPKRDDSSNR